MWQVLFHIPYFGIPVYGYGVMLVIGFFLAMEVGKFLARHSRIDPEVFANAALIALVAGVAGARLSHVIENWAQYSRADRTFWQNFRDAINIRTGGLTYYGGFLLAFPAVLAYGIYKRVPLRTGMDIVAPCLMIGLGLGRVGCYLNGCCYGADCELPGLHVNFPYNSDAYRRQFELGQIKVPEALLGRGPDGTPYPLPTETVERDPELRALAAAQHANGVQPAELYSAFTGLLLAAFLFAYFTLPHIPGRVFALMLLVEGTCRFLLEILRVEPGVRNIMGYEFSLSMLIAIGLVVLGSILWVLFGILGYPKIDAPLAVDVEAVPA